MSSTAKEQSVMSAADSLAQPIVRTRALSGPPDDVPLSARVPWAHVRIGATGMLIGGALASYAYQLAKTDQASGRALIWLALAVILTGLAFTLASQTISAGQGLFLSLTLCTVLFLFKLGREPTSFGFTDELQHVRSTAELLRGAQLFVHNPINPVLAHFPGLDVVTAELVRVTGLSLFAAANVVVYAGRLLLTVSLFALYQRLLPSPRLAVLAVALYAANPSYLYFDAQFSYESLALPLAIAAIALVLASEARSRQPPLKRLITLLLIGSTIVTHHITSYLLAILLLFFAVAFWREDRSRAKSLLQWGVLAASGAAAWGVFVAPDAWQYLEPGLLSALKAVPNFLTGHGHARTPFNASPIPSPLYERVAGLVSVLLCLLTLLAGVLVLRRRRTVRGPLGWCTLLGLGYFVSLPIQLLQGSTATPIAPRIWETTFIGLAPVSALGVGKLWRRFRRGPIRGAWLRATGVCTASVFIMLMGGATIRSGPNIRLPGPYLPSSGPLAATPDTIAAARWLLVTYGPERRVMGDFTLASVFGAYALAAPETYQNYGVKPWRVYFTPTFTPNGFYQLDSSGTQFVVIDRRITEYRPFGGFYFSASEPHEGFAVVPEVDLKKFDVNPLFKRVYDNGNILIYHYEPGRPSQLP